MNDDKQIVVNHESIDKITKALSPGIAESINQATGIINQLATAVAESVNRFYYAVYTYFQFYDNQRVMYLALLAKKKRVRKKNFRRIIKNFSRKDKQK